MIQTMTLPEIDVPAHAIDTPHGKLTYPGLTLPARMMLVDPAEVAVLVKAARDAADLAYSVYQVQFPVGAAVIMADDPTGQVFQSGNSENAVLNSGICAERALLNYVVGQGFRRIKALVVSTAHRDKDDVTLRSPCGLCRQTIREFADDNSVIIIDHDAPGHLGDILDINRLLPYGYHYVPVEA